MSDPSKRKSNIFKKSLLIFKGQKNSNRACWVDRVQIKFPARISLAIKQWLSSKLARVQSRESTLLSSC